MLDRLAGNEAMKQHLQAALAGGKLAHSLLLCGEKGCGAGFAARCLAADYLYPQGGPAAEAVLAGQAPECLEVRGEGASGQIRIERIRQVREEVFHSALSAQGRVVLLYGAQNLNSASANALLKVLEEPPEGVLFLLTASSPAAVLATIRSRCAAYDLSPLPPAQCAAWLKNQRPACREAEFLAAVYEGSPGRCLAAVDDPEVTAGLNAARQLAGLIRGMGAHVNLIPINPVDGSPYSASDAENVRRFQQKLEELGVNATVRRRLGSDISAACGQLRREDARAGK